MNMLTWMIFKIVFLSASYTIAAVNLYRENSDFPDDVTADSPCGKALNASIACENSLAAANVGASLDGKTLDALCLPSCYNSLVSYRKSIKTACGTSGIIQGTDATFANTYLADRLIYTYNTTCIKDATTKVWCSEVFSNTWAGITGDQAIETLDPKVLCTSCTLQVLSLTQQSAFGYDPDFVDNAWPMVKSKCRLNLSFSDPGQYYLNITTPDPGPVTCISGKTYTVQSGDTCQSIAVSQSVSTNDLISINNILPGCTSIFVGQKLCLPLQCETYTVQAGDTCDSIVNARQADMTYAQFLVWNPTINPWCSNLVAGTNICVRTPGGAFSPIPASTGVIPTGTFITTATPAPTGTAPGAPTNCGRWYVVAPGETCNTIILSEGITLEKFLAINPQVNAECTNLWADAAYCVYTVDKGPIPSSYAPPPSNIAKGTTTNCYQYYVAVSGDSCAAIAFTQVANLTDFMRWNSGINAGCTNLAVGSAYCVWGDPKDSKKTTTTSAPGSVTVFPLPPTTAAPTDTCTWVWCTATLTNMPTVTTTGKPPTTTIISTSTTITNPSPTKTGVPRPPNAAPNSIKACNKWHTAVSGDFCFLICQNEGCTVSDLQLWNPDLGKDCVVQLGVAYCVSA